MRHTSYDYEYPKDPLQLRRPATLLPFFAAPNVPRSRCEPHSKTGARTGARLVGLGGRCYSGVVAPVAQRIEHRPPEPVAGVRVAPGALHHPSGAWRSGSALGLGPRGRQFKPARPDQLPSIGPMHTCVFSNSRKPEEGICPRSHNGHTPSTKSSRAQERLHACGAAMRPLTTGEVSVNTHAAGLRHCCVRE